MLTNFAELTSVELFMSRAYRLKENLLAGSCSAWRTFAQASGTQNLSAPTRSLITIGETAPGFSRAVGMALPTVCPLNTSGGFWNIFNGCQPHATAQIRRGMTIGRGRPWPRRDFRPTGAARFLVGGDPRRRPGRLAGRKRWRLPARYRPGPQ